jgi:trehalose/maltose hydrolase-like predicted phosphorylase
MLQPEINRSLLDYRYERLDAAIQFSFSHGFDGAIFPWESAEDGSEDTPVWALTGAFEHHITACVGWAFWKYYQVTKDKKWLEEKGYPVLKEVADFWVSRAESGEDGKYHIYNVIGANEWEENIDDNAFTNGIAKLVLKYAAEAANIIGETASPNWTEVSENIPILTFSDGTTRENATYEGQMIKQADVNLLSHPLRLITDKEQMEKDLKYYEKRMSSEGPAMGFATLATIYAQLDEPEKAYEIWTHSYRPNEVPPFGVLAEVAGGTNPYFATGAGGMLQTVLSGFGGLQFSDEGIKQESGILPKKWKSLKITGVGTTDETFSVE